MYRKCKRARKGNESAILTWSCLSSLSGYDGAPGSRLRRLHLYNVRWIYNTTLLASSSACPSLVDLEIVGFHAEFVLTLESLSEHCPLLERLILESSDRGRGDFLPDRMCHEFVLNCPNITTLSLKEFKLNDDNAHILVKGFHMLKYDNFSTSYLLTGSFLKNLGTNGGGNHLEVMILRECENLNEVDVEQFMEALLAGDLRLLRYLDISNRCGLASDGVRYPRCISTSFMPTKKLLEQRPNFRLQAEFPVNMSII